MRRAYSLIWDLNHVPIADPTGMSTKTIAATRTGRALVNPMIYLNLTATLRRVGSWADTCDQRAKRCVSDIFTYHRKPDMHCTLETVEILSGEFMDEFTACVVGLWAARSVQLVFDGGSRASARPSADGGYPLHVPRRH